MRPNRNRLFFGSAGLVVLALGAAACSSSNSPTTTTTSQSPTTSSASTGSSSTTVKVASNATFGDILVDGAGKALYTYGPDAGHNGISQCSGACLQAWPALTVPAGTTPTAGPGVTGTLAAVPQPNGTDQVTYDGSPLYTFPQDTAQGEVTGNGVNGFSVAKVSGTSASGPGGAASTTTSTTSAGGGYGY